MQQFTERQIQELDHLAEERRNRIRTSETDVIITGTRYYLSADGCDDSDGRTAGTAWKTIERLNAAPLCDGDGVFFRRGDVFRGSVTARQGVTYAAYGEGDKPKLWASPFDGTKTGKWEQTDVPDVYRYSEPMHYDVGCIIFNYGEAVGLKATVDFSEHINRTNGKPFSSWRDLAADEDLAFYHDLGGPNIESTGDTDVLYLKSTGGDPGRRFSSMEFNIRRHGIAVRGNQVRISNLCIQYCGCHGISAGTTDGLHVDHCEFDWIGGAMQYYRDGKPVRFGNAVEIYGGCRDYTVEYCYVNQVYDAGLTHQYSSGGDNSILMSDVTYKGNLIENCIYSIEYFCGRPDRPDVPRHMHHVRIFDNIMRYSGYGFGKQRPNRGSDVHIKSWDHENDADDMIFENNIFFLGDHGLLHVAGDRGSSMPVIRRNVFVQTEGHDFARLGVNPTKVLPYSEEAIASQHLVGDDNLFYELS